MMRTHFMEESRMGKVPRSRRWLIVAVVSALLAGCGGDNDDEDRPERPVDGTFVGKVAGTDALVAVVAAPPQRGRDRRDVTVYVSDGERVSESLTGSVEANSFRARSPDGAEVEGKLSRGGATGTVQLPDDEASQFHATRATAAAGLYDLTVSSRGRLSGASASGVGLESSSTLRAPGTGRLRFADGERRKFALTGGSAGDPTRLRSGQLRLIVLPSGELSGGGEAQASSGGDELQLFIRSSEQ